MGTLSKAPKTPENNAPAKEGKKAESSNMSNILQHIKNLETNNVSLKGQLQDAEVRNKGSAPRRARACRARSTPS